MCTDPVCLERHLYLLISSSWYSNSRSIHALIVHPHSKPFTFVRSFRRMLCIVPWLFFGWFQRLDFLRIRNFESHFFGRSHTQYIASKWHGFGCASVKWSFSYLLHKNFNGLDFDHIQNCIIVGRVVVLYYVCDSTLSHCLWSVFINAYHVTNAWICCIKLIVIISLSVLMLCQNRINKSFPHVPKQIKSEK